MNRRIFLKMLAGVALMPKNIIPEPERPTLEDFERAINLAIRDFEDNLKLASRNWIPRYGYIYQEARIEIPANSSNEGVNSGNMTV